jgi:hypothetical protein
MAVSPNEVIGAIPTQVVEALHPTFQTPGYALAGAAIIATGVLLDMRKRSVENAILADSQHVADPDVAERVSRGLNSTRRRERIGHYAAVLFFGLGALQLAQPYAMHTEMNGDASLVVDASYASGVADMQGDSGSTITRFQASVEGGLAAASAVDVPFSVELEGLGNIYIGTMPATNKDIAATKQKIKDNVNVTFQNGNPSFSEGAKQAAPLSGESANNIIILASNISKDDLVKLAALKAELSKTNKTLSAVVVGAGDGTFQVATESLKSPTDVQAFTKVLGADHVKTAHSSAEVEAAVKDIVETAVISNVEEPINTYGNIALAAAVLGGLVASRRRLAGVLSARNKGRK